MENSNGHDKSFQVVANGVFFDTLYSFAESLSEDKRELFIEGIRGKFEGGKLIRSTVTNSSGLLNQIAEILRSDANKPIPPLLEVALAGCLDCALALQEDEQGDTSEALSWLVQAGIQFGCVKVVLGMRKKKFLKHRSSSNAASRLARIRHTENYQLAKDAIDHWRQNISPNLSAQKAADQLLKVVPLGHKKLAELVSAEKKKVSRLRTPEPERKA